MLLPSKASWCFFSVIFGLIFFSFPHSSSAQNRITKLPDLNGDGIPDLVWTNPTSGQSIAWLMNGLGPSQAGVLPSDPSWMIAAAGDFNGDGMTDLLWTNPSNGQIIEWLMNGVSVSSATVLLSDLHWTVVGAADLNGDRKTDILLYNASTGQTVAWIMNGNTIASWSLLLMNPMWKIIATADFNGDGMADLLWHNDSTGQTDAWLMNGLTPWSKVNLLTDPNWKVIATADLNGDKMADFLWYNSTTGETALWLLNGTTPTVSVILLRDANWKVEATADLNGDGNADLLWSNNVTGQTAVWLMSGSNVLNNPYLQTDSNWQIQAAADLNGDGKSDLLWYNAATGQTAVWLMDGVTSINGTNLSTDPEWRLRCIKSSELTSDLVCNDALTGSSVGNVPVPSNQAPVVNAGPDQTIALSAAANLSGTVTDDGIPLGQVTSAWSQVGGPGTVVFGNAAVPRTTATFSAAGTYTLRLTASDGSLSSVDDVVVIVNGASSPNQDVPACGTAISLFKTIVANVSDGVGVVNVQMQLDGVDLGVAISSPPYALGWDTRTASNGCHQLAVIARDNAGNRGTASMFVQVSNP